VIEALHRCKGFDVATYRALSPHATKLELNSVVSGDAAIGVVQ
jgi:hypothetical protein